MLTTDDLFLINAMLADDRVLRADVILALKEIYGSESYRAWMNTSAEAHPYSQINPSAFRVLSAARMATEQSGMLIKVNIHSNTVFVTDGSWMPGNIRVFPYNDESQALTTHIQRAGLADWADCIIDVATGCGHSLIGQFRELDRIGLDINPRAICYGTINKTLSGDDGPALIVNDIHKGIPAHLLQTSWRRVLILGNVPFALAPPGIPAPLTSDGGSTGIDLQVASFEAISRFAQPFIRRGANVRACLLSYTVGNESEGRWQAIERAAEIFGTADIKWRLLHEEKIVRVDGACRLPNPSPIGKALQAWSRCILNFDSSPATKSRFAELAKGIQTARYRDLGYLAIDVDVT